MNYLALTTVILAVCATLSTFKGGGYSTRSVLAQSQASDNWAFYQSKSIKGKKSIWILGLITGIFGIFYFVNGFFLFIQ